VIDKDNEVTPISVHSSLAWASRIWAAPNGTFVALGAARQSGIQFQRFDSEGALVGSGSWSDDPNAALVGAAPLPDGRLALVTSSETGRALLALSPEDVLKVTGTLGFTSSLELGCCNGAPLSFAVTPAGEYLLTGYTKPDTGLWWSKVDRVGGALGNHVWKDTTFGQSVPKVVSGASGTFSAFTASAVEGGTGQRYVVRLGQHLDELWHVNSPDTRSLVEDLLPLPDGVLVSGRVDLNRALVRFDRDGNSVALGLTLGDSTRLVAASDYDVVLLEQSLDLQTKAGFSLTRIRLPPLPTAPEPAGGICEVGSDCVSAQCCLQGTARVGTCASDAGCPLNTRCAHDEQCENGKCLLGVAVCSQTCSKSEDCPENTYCSEACSEKPCASVCLPDCLGQKAGYCEAFGTWTCQRADNAEGVQVSICQP